MNIQSFRPLLSVRRHLPSVKSGGMNPYVGGSATKQRLQMISRTLGVTKNRAQQQLSSDLRLPSDLPVGFLIEGLSQRHFSAVSLEMFLGKDKNTPKDGAQTQSKPGFSHNLSHLFETKSQNGSIDDLGARRNRKKLKKEQKKARQASVLNKRLPSISFKKEDRQFYSFWKDKMTVIPGDNRRHIPLVAVMKGMLLSVSNEMDSAVSSHQSINGKRKAGEEQPSHMLPPSSQQAEFSVSLDHFILNTTGETVQGNLESKAKKTLSILTNLRSHIFLGFGHSNQIIGSLADSLAQSERATLVKFDQATTCEQLEASVKKFEVDFKERMNSSAAQCELLLNTKTRDLNRDALVQQSLCQFSDVVSVLTQENYPDLEIFKAEAKALVKNLRDSYSTDVSDAGNDQVRTWQNTNWLPGHQAMLQLLDTPSVTGLDAVLKDVVRMETEFAQLVSGLINQQGFQTVPADFMMGSQTKLNSDEFQPVRKALEALLQQPE